MIGKKLLLAATLLTATGAACAQDATGSWDGLIEVRSKRMDAAFLLPGADFRPYTKVIVDPTQVAFRKDWLKDTNQNRPRLTSQVTDEQAHLAPEEREEAQGIAGRRSQ